MRIAVIGVAGRLGRKLADSAVVRGHAVVGLARDPAALEGPLSDVVRGDARDRDAVERTILGTDAVVSTLSGGDRRDPTRARDATRTLIEGMHRCDVRRLVVTSAYPLVGDRPRIPLALLRLVLATPFADGRAVEQLVSGSDLDWTLVRLNRLTDGPPVGPPVVSTGLLDRPAGLTRADAADLCLALLEQRSHLGEAVNVAGRERVNTR